MAINTDFNVQANSKAPRKLLKHYVNVGTQESVEWELLGVGIEDSAIETNFETEDVNDILGNHETSVTGAAPSQSFEPFTVRGGSKLAFKLHEIWLNKEYEKLSQFDMLTVYGYVGSNTDGYDADMQSDCTITFSSIGGSAYVDMPITVNYSDKKTRGTVKFTDGSPDFFFNGKILISGTWEFDNAIVGLTSNQGSAVKFKSNNVDFIGMSLEETNDGTIYYAQHADEEKGTMVYGIHVWIDDAYRTISFYAGQYVYPHFFEKLTSVARRIA